MLKVINVSKAYGSQELFDNISFNINPGERIGLVGRNGHGKTTLFRIFLGEEEVDQGNISIPNNYTISQVSQHIAFSQPSVLEEACLGLPAKRKNERWLAQRILAGLGFSTQDQERGVETFSGGYQVRLNLAKALLADPNLLLLDEPTNYLDVVSIRWLSQFLQKWKNELVLVTHDRGFMDSVVTHVVGIHRKSVTKLPGTTEKLYNQLDKEDQIHEKTRLNIEKKRREAERFITRFRAKARMASQVQSKIKAIERQGRLQQLEAISDLDFSFRCQPTPAKTILSTSPLYFSYTPEGPELLAGLSISIGRHDRICVIGKNGKGKTTLLRILAQELTPTSGEIKLHPKTIPCHYAQTNTIRLDLTKTIEEELMATGCEKQKARAICGVIMFGGDDALKRIQVLSGGEKSRVLLGKMLAKPSNLLLLDEPTNHLDMQACDAFLEAVEDFDGAAVIVTHNESYLHALANRLVVFQNGEVIVFEGSYQDFLEKIGWTDEQPDDKAPETQLENSAMTRKEIRKLRADVLQRQSQELKPLTQKIERLQNEIKQKESQIESINTKLIQASEKGDGNQIGQLSADLAKLTPQIDPLYTQLFTLMEEQEDKTARFTEELEAIDSSPDDPPVR